MKKYIFKLYPAEFTQPKALGYNSIEHRVINEISEQFTIIAIAEDIQPALIKAQEEKNKLIAVNFSTIRTIDFYHFKLKLITIEELI